MKKLLILVIALLLVSPALVSANMLVNPGFETGSETPWMRLGGHIGTVTTGAAYTGAAGLDITMNTASGDWGGYYQNKPANPGEYYTFSAWVDTSRLNSEANASLQISYFDVLNPGSSASPIAAFNTVSVTENTWEQLTLSPAFSAPAGTQSVRFVLAEYATASWGEGNVYYDDAEASVVPEPSSLMLLLTGITGIFGLGLKRKK